MWWYVWWYVWWYITFWHIVLHTHAYQLKLYCEQSLCDHCTCDSGLPHYASILCDFSEYKGGHITEGFWLEGFRHNYYYCLISSRRTYWEKWARRSLMQAPTWSKYHGMYRWTWKIQGSDQSFNQRLCSFSGVGSRPPQWVIICASALFGVCSFKIHNKNSLGSAGPGVRSRGLGLEGIQMNCSGHQQPMATSQ